MVSFREVLSSQFSSETPNGSRLQPDSRLHPISDDNSRQLLNLTCLYWNPGLRGQQHSVCCQSPGCTQLLNCCTAALLILNPCEYSADTWPRISEDSFLKEKKNRNKREGKAQPNMLRHILWGNKAEDGDSSVNTRRPQPTDGSCSKGSFTGLSFGNWNVLLYRNSIFLIVLVTSL